MIAAFGRLLRQWHKWIGVLVGVQVLIWTISGAYMVAVSIDFIHGDSLVRDIARPLSNLDAVLPIQQAGRGHGEIYSAKLVRLPGSARIAYELNSEHGVVRVDALTGAPLSALSQEDIERVAREYYTGTSPIVRAALLDRAPVEARGRKVPLWRVDFDDWLHTSFYLNPDTGALLTRRHRFWRIFDAMWMLHIMDYGAERDDPHNNLLRTSAAIGIAFSLTGLVLLFFSFRRRRLRGATS